MNSGIYSIINKENGHRYVGSSVNLNGRFRGHRNHLKGDTHGNRHLQRAWNKYGEDAFEFQVLFYCDPEMCITLEQRAMDILGPEYNIEPIAGSSLGVTRTKEYRAKKSAAMMGKKNALGHKCSDEAKAKISAANKGNKYSVGCKHTEESKVAKSAAMMGNKNAAGHKVTDDARAKMSASHTGKPWSKLRRARYEARCSS